ncbi:MAG TPA: branched-chain amino acid ABC transporter permease, partial [Candidatus Methylomirabilis sp.]|nr:branched-chain amino acid ABC transporter permease [Candidatus Methylomirabilis sp.]
TYYKILALAISGFFTALAGSFYALYTQYVSPDEVFGVFFSVKVIFISLVGGVGTIWGPVVGAVIMTVLEEWLRVYFPYSHEFIYGLLIVVVMLFMPTGIMGKLGEWTAGLEGRTTEGAVAGS